MIYDVETMNYDVDIAIANIIAIGISFVGIPQ